MSRVNYQPFLWPPADEDMVAEFSISGCWDPGGWEEGPSGPDIQILSVTEDKPGGRDREDVVTWLLGPEGNATLRALEEAALEDDLADSFDADDTAVES
jgi:hypothetical protein